MKLYRTVCSTDWKGRPHHNLTLLGTSDDAKYLRRLRNEDVREWMAMDVANDRADEDEELDADQLAQELKAEPKLKSLWKNEDRWEMSRTAGNPRRQFVERYDDGGLTTTVYHFLNE